MITVCHVYPYRWVAASLLVVSICGCESLNRTQNGALLGSGAGALAGAIIGHQTGNRDAGALIGAATGGIAGGLVGNAQDKTAQRDAAMAEANHQHAMRIAEQRAISNADVIKMVQSGVSEDIIIGTIRDHGGRFDMRPDAIITLSQNGVRSPVIEAMRKANYTR